MLIVNVIRFQSYSRVLLYFNLRGFGFYLKISPLNKIYNITDALYIYRYIIPSTLTLKKTFKHSPKTCSEFSQNSPVRMP